MRLSADSIRIIRERVAAVVGAEASVLLFGSRLNSAGRGGDIDLLVEVPVAVSRPAETAARLAAMIGRALDGRQVDVVLAAPNLREQSIHVHARAHGVLL